MCGLRAESGPPTEISGSQRIFILKKLQQINKIEIFYKYNFISVFSLFSIYSSAYYMIVPL